MDRRWACPTAPTGLQHHYKELIMDRRDFLKGASASGLGLALSQPHRTAAAAGSPPNILFILVDEMRFPTEFPEGVHSPEEFLSRFMPHSYSQLKDCVNF